MTHRRPIPELRSHADKVPGYGHLVAHEMVDEIEELRAKCQARDHAEPEDDESMAKLDAAMDLIDRLRQT